MTVASLLFSDIDEGYLNPLPDGTTFFEE